MRVMRVVAEFNATSTPPDFNRGFADKRRGREVRSDQQNTVVSIS